MPEERAIERPSRRPIPRETELNVLDQSRRRCALCFHLNGDLAEKHGQIAHLDNNPANYAEGNLAFLCMEHHSLYDSTTSQHRNYTIAEVKAARTKLCQAIIADKHFATAATLTLTIAGVETDRRSLDDLVAFSLLRESIEFLRTNNFAGFAFDWDRLSGLQSFLHQNGPEHEFIDPELEGLRQRFYNTGKQLTSYLGLNTWYIGNGNWATVPADWEMEQPERFSSVVGQIHDMAENICDSWDELIRTARSKLAP